MTAQLFTYRFPVVRDGRVIGGLTWSHEDGYVAWDWNGDAIDGAGSVIEAVAMVEVSWRAHLARERRLILYQQAYRLSWQLTLAELTALEDLRFASDRAASVARWRRWRRLSDRALARLGRRHEQMKRGLAQ